MRLNSIRVCFIVAAFLPLSGSIKAASPKGMTRLADLPYVTGGGVRQQLDLYLPEKTPATRMPVVIWIHGGGWHAGSKGENGGPYPQLVLKGYAVACIQYRFTDSAPMPAQLEDCKSAVRWLRAHADEYHLDGSHIAAWGHSAGGHLASMLGVTSGIRGFDVGENLDRSSAVQAVIDWSGPTDILAMAGKSEKSLTDPNDTLAKLVGGPIRGHEDQAKAASPITYVRPGVPPFLIAHSDADPIVPFSQAEELRDALQKAKVEVVWRPLHGVPHWDKALVSREMFDASLAFLDRNLKGTGPTTAPSPSGSNAGRLPKNS